MQGGEEVAARVWGEQQQCVGWVHRRGEGEGEGAGGCAAASGVSAVRKSAVRHRRAQHQRASTSGENRGKKRRALVCFIFSFFATLRVYFALAAFLPAHH